jgi:hypothetical protein
MPALDSNTTGQVFKSTATDVASGLITMVPLSNDPIPQLFPSTFDRRHNTTCDAFIDACVAVLEGKPPWRQKASPDRIVTERQNIRRLLREKPPGVIILDQHAANGYGFHDRTPSLWPFICITKHYVDRWMAIEVGGDLRRNLEAVLKGSIDHEIGHWLFTLVRNIGANAIQICHRLERQLRRKKNSQRVKSLDLVRDSDSDDVQCLRHDCQIVRRVWDLPVTCIAE